MTNGISYRPEVDGLRALAVIGVVLYHYRLGFSGGFVGVDVFFVISGYLITSIILKDLDSGTFTMPRFWVRRIRRILPAVSFLVLSLLAIGSLVLEPRRLVDLAKSAVAQSALASNVYFWRTTSGYFSEGVEFLPLLHTWSLAVEEQFYLFFPVIMWLIYKRWKKNLPAILACIGALSLALCVLGMHRFERASFYLLPTRAWELMTGALIAIAGGKLSMGKGISETLSWLGVAMIIAAMQFFSDSTPFPGFAAILPVAGTTFIIIGTNNGRASVARLLSLKPIVAVGLISYSLYLWHWPLIVIARLVLIEVSVTVRIGLIAASMIIAYFSWRFVEKPFRERRILKKPSSVFAFGLACVAAMLISAEGIVALRGMPARFSARDTQLLEDASLMGQEYEMHGGKGIVIGTRKDGDTAAEPDFAVLGDSHAMPMGKQLDSQAARFGLNGIAFIRSGVAPMSGLWKLTDDENTIRDNERDTSEILDLILKSKARNVILIGRWSAYCEGYGKNEIINIPSSWGIMGHMVVDTTDGSPSPDDSARVLKKHLAAMVDRFKKAGITVWLFEQVPEADQPRVARDYYLMERFPVLNAIEKESTSLEEHRARQARADAVLESMASPGVYIVDPTPSFFPAGRSRLELFDDRAIYWDDDHLTAYGAQKYIGPLLDQIYMKIAAQDGGASSG
jgi:peptidoglycan/LPS O-acetylase OafA/YrhL